MELMAAVGTVWFWIWMLIGFTISAIYNRFVIDRLHYDERMEPWTWLTVVFGVAYSLIILGIATWRLDIVLIAFIVFVFTGLPMAAGDIARYWAKLGGDLLHVFEERLQRKKGGRREEK